MATTAQTTTINPTDLETAINLQKRRFFTSPFALCFTLMEEMNWKAEHAYEVAELVIKGWTKMNTFRITIIFKSGKTYRKYGLTFNEAMEIKDEYITHKINQIINLYMIPE